MTYDLYINNAKYIPKKYLRFWLPLNISTEIFLPYGGNTCRNDIYFYKNILLIIVVLVMIKIGTAIAMLIILLT